MAILEWTLWDSTWFDTTSSVGSSTTTNTTSSSGSSTTTNTTSSSGSTTNRLTVLMESISIQNFIPGLPFFWFGTGWLCCIYLLECNHFPHFLTTNIPICLRNHSTYREILHTTRDHRRLLMISDTTRDHRRLSMISDATRDHRRLSMISDTTRDHRRLLIISGSTPRSSYHLEISETSKNRQYWIDLAGIGAPPRYLYRVQLYKYRNLISFLLIVSVKHYSEIYL